MVTAAGNEKVVTKKRETSGVFWLTFLAIFALATVAFRSGTPPAITPSVATTTAAPARAPASCAPLSNLVIVGQTPARSSGSAAPTTGLPSCSAAPSSSDNGFAYQAPVTPGYGVTSSTTGLPRTNYVSGYTRSNGTYVHPYYRSSR